MLITSLSVLVPVLFVMGLGYWAGRAKKFSDDQRMGLNELVMIYALPALMFVATATTTRTQMFAEGPFLLAVLISFLGLYLGVAAFSLTVLKNPIGAAGLQAFLVTYPSVAFFGIPIFRGLFGEGSLVSIAAADVLASITIAPLTVVFLEIHVQQRDSGEVKQPGALIWKGLVNSFKKPMVWAPLLGAAFVLLELDLPDAIDKGLALIGSTTGGASLFLAGLIIASYSVKVNTEIIGNVVAKMILQPALMAGLVMLLAIPNPLGREAILICAIPASAVAPILAARYQVYEIESASTVVIDSLLMLATFTIAVVLTGN